MAGQFYQNVVDDRVDDFLFLLQIHQDLNQ